jgi:hypothetical protein
VLNLGCGGFFCYRLLDTAQVLGGREGIGACRLVCHAYMYKSNMDIGLCIQSRRSYPRGVHNTFQHEIPHGSSPVITASRHQIPNIARFLGLENRSTPAPRTSKTSNMAMGPCIFGSLGNEIRRPAAFPRLVGILFWWDCPTNLLIRPLRFNKSASGSRRLTPASALTVWGVMASAIPQIHLLGHVSASHGSSWSWQIHGRE